MNARRHVIDLTCDVRQVEDSVSCLFHTILFHRCLGKFRFRDDPLGQTIVIGTVGYDDVDCSAVDLTYVRCSSPGLEQAVSREVKPFALDMLHMPSSSTADIALEFYEKRPRGLAVMGHDKLPWEIWVLKLTLASITSESDRLKYRYELASVLSEKMLMVVDAMNRYDYVPKNPHKDELGVVFNTSFSDVQPYLFRVTRNPTQARSGLDSKKVLDQFWKTLEV